MSLKPKPLGSVTAARSTLAHRLTNRVDRIRQLNTRFGLRSLRVFLVWSKFSGAERGEGRETIIARVELLPTPRVSDLTAIARRPYSLGVFKEGSIRIDQISGAKYTRDMLLGLEIPIVDQLGNVCGCRPCGAVNPLKDEPVEARGPDGVERTTDEQIDFWWETVEDGRGDSPAETLRYRVFGGPSRSEGRFDWSMNLELADEPTDRSGRPQIGVNTSEQTPESSFFDEEGPL